MKQLTFGNVLKFINKLKEEGMPLEEIYKLPIYIGNDDELNGIHCAWYTDIVDSNDTEGEDNEYLVAMINEDHCNVKLEGKALVIS